MTIVLPRLPEGPLSYTDTCVKYLKSVFLQAGAVVEEDYTPPRKGIFISFINGEPVEFDIMDGARLYKYTQNVVYKFHTTKDLLTRVRPFPPYSFDDWSAKDEIESMGLYKPLKGKRISMRQSLHGSTVERRSQVRSMLSQVLGERLATDRIPKREYFLDIANIQAAVCVPGHCNNILDRGQLQYMALGVCTVSPNIPEVLPFNKVLEPGVHYIRCRDDYQDLVSLIENLSEAQCTDIGTHAKELFNSACSPTAVLHWVEQFPRGGMVSNS